MTRTPTPKPPHAGCVTYGVAQLRDKVLASLGDIVVHETWAASRVGRIVAFAPGACIRNSDPPVYDSVVLQLGTHNGDVIWYDWRVTKNMRIATPREEALFYGELHAVEPVAPATSQPNAGAMEGLTI